MYDNYIELMIEGMTRGRELQDAFILVLREKEGKRFLPILIPHNGYDMIANALKHKDFTCSKLMNKLAGRVGMTMIGVRLMQPMVKHKPCLTLSLLMKWCLSPCPWPKPLCQQ